MSSIPEVPTHRLFFGLYMPTLGHADQHKTEFYYARKTYQDALVP